MVYRVLFTGTVLTLYQTKKSAQSKLKAFGDKKLKVTQNIIFVYHMVENNDGNTENCWLPAFSYFPSIFLKGAFLRSIKVHHCTVQS